MTALLALLAALSFAAACVSTGLLLAERAKLASYKHVGTWYEKRVEELEDEGRQLAAQVVQLGMVPSSPHIAMPIPQRDPDEDYAYDTTGLIRETLDPREVQYG